MTLTLISRRTGQTREVPFDRSASALDELDAVLRPVIAETGDETWIPVSWWGTYGPVGQPVSFGDGIVSDPQTGPWAQIADPAGSRRAQPPGTRLWWSALPDPGEALDSVRAFDHAHDDQTVTYTVTRSLLRILPEHEGVQNVERAESSDPGDDGDLPAWQVKVTVQETGN